MVATSELESTIQSAAERFGPAVVGVERASGLLIAPGRVLTAAHALRRREAVVALADETRQGAEVIASDLDLDLAVLAVEIDGVEPLAPANGDPDARLGRTVLALANPGGSGLRVTAGFVSSAAASFRGPRGRRIAHAIEHTAPLPRGSSGGPLLGADGTLLGINAVRVDSGLILAIPFDAAVRGRLQALQEGRPTDPMRLGVAVAPARVARRLQGAVGLPERDGVLVRAVEVGSPAGRAGVHRGDLIVSAGGAQVAAIDDLYDALDSVAGDGQIELGIVRGIDELAVSVRFPGR